MREDRDRPRRNVGPRRHPPHRPRGRNPRPPHPASQSPHRRPPRRPPGGQRRTHHRAAPRRHPHRPAPHRSPRSRPHPHRRRPRALGAIRARVQVVVPALTILDPTAEHDDPADLIGHGPLDAATARSLAEATTLPWDRVITHPITGAVLHTDTYHRTTAIDRYLRARDRRCRWPGCTVPAIRCEVDHTRDHALGGPTHVANLAHLCQRHHTQKQFTRWSVKQLPGGILQWTSPTGRTYTDEPLPYSPRRPLPPTTHPRPTPTTTAHPHRSDARDVLPGMLLRGPGRFTLGSFGGVSWQDCRCGEAPHWVSTRTSRSACRPARSRGNIRSRTGRPTGVYESVGRALYAQLRASRLGNRSSSTEQHRGGHRAPAQK